jgi:flagellar protein FliS
MSVYSPSRATAYKEQSILTATPGQLVVMLYDGCLRFLVQAAYAMREGDMPVAGNRLSRAEAIIDELLTTLDLEQGGDIASRLQGIYVFCSRHLMEARAERDADKVEKVSELLGELRESWAQVAVAG